MTSFTFIALIQVTTPTSWAWTLSAGQLIAIAVMFAHSKRVLEKHLNQKKTADEDVLVLRVVFDLSRINLIALVVTTATRSAAWVIANNVLALQLISKYQHEIAIGALGLAVILILDMYRRHTKQVKSLRASHAEYEQMLHDTRKELESMTDDRNAQEAEKKALAISLQLAAKEVLHFSVLLTPSGHSPDRVTITATGWGLESLGRQIIDEEWRANDILYRLRHPPKPH